ncbi:phosphatidylserine decarboxylase-domain-containing protein [Cubamyces lactineus]|nr:phosphatidylserine decarboxylase-domain-containing protein [Cubamyces lactineus]
MSPNIVQQLIDYLDTHPDFAKDFRESFESAHRDNVAEFEEYNIHSFEDYLDYLDSFLNWVPCENKNGTAIYDRMCIFYYVLDKPPVNRWQTPIDPSSSPPWTWLSQWAIDYAKEIGKAMNESGSLTPETLQTFYDCDAYHMEDYIVPPGGWKTFNEFFTRRIKPEVRPIDALNDNRIILLDDENNARPYGKDFVGGTFCHSFLNSTDYHRIHAPIAGEVVEARVIQGLCYLQVEAVPDVKGRNRIGIRRRLLAPDQPGFQFLQTRGLVLIKDPDVGLVAVLPVGMPQVASVVLTVKPGDVLKKGEEIGYFQMGGSDIVMVFQPQARVEFTAKDGQWRPYGKEIARARGESQ